MSSAGLQLVKVSWEVKILALAETSYGKEYIKDIYPALESILPGYARLVLIMSSGVYSSL